jgi:hypothetical protein
MRILTIKEVLYISLILSIYTHDINAQDQAIKLSQNQKFEQLLNEKRKINSSIVLNERYKIQIFSGSSENAKKTLNEFKQEFKDLDATIVFNTPNYKVWTGNFKTRIEAERNLAEVRKKYSNALLIKPQK